ncbi:MAG: hypothetical protein AB7V50_00160 [Vampirovibrionia bacterium]
MAIKMQAREQSILGLGAIGAVFIIGIWGPVADFGVWPQWNKFGENAVKLGQASTTVQQNEATLANLNQQKLSLSNSKAEIPEGKTIGEINTAEGQTKETIKRDILNTIIDMSQVNHGNILISAKPIAPIGIQATPPPPPGADPTAPLPPKLSDYVDEISFDIKIRGSYVSLNDFINELAANDVVVEINDLEIYPEGGSNQPTEDPTRPLKASLKLSYFIKKQSL